MGEKLGENEGEKLGRSAKYSARKARYSESGQATLEMVLLALVSIIVGLGLIYRFNTAFKKYTVDLYGTYYRCLLETGELPGVGSVCGDRQARFAIANGRALVKEGNGGNSGSSGSGSSGSGSGSGSSGSGNSGSSSGSNGSQASGKSNSGSGDGSGGSSSPEAVGAGNQSSGGGRGSVIGRLRNLSKPRSTAVGNVSDGSGGGDENRATSPNGATATSSRSGLDGLRQARTKTEFRMDGEQYQRADTAALSSATASAIRKESSRDGDSLRPRKAVVSTERKPAASMKDDKGGGLEFGKLFRLFLIFGIIVAIVIFLGGQVLQISKSGER